MTRTVIKPPKALQQLAWSVTIITFCVGIGIGIWRGSWTQHFVTIHVIAQPVIELWMHNASIVFLALFGIISLGIFTWFIVLWNGLNFGYVAIMTVHHYGVMILLGGVLPQAIFEIPGDLVAFQADMLCVGAIVRYVLHRLAKHPGGSGDIMPVLQLAAKRNLIAVGVLGVAAVIESFVTPVILRGLLH